MYYKIINKKKKTATALADFFGYVLWSPVNFLRPKKDISPPDIKEILVIRTAYTGDVIMTLPALKPLKELYPDARISFLTSSKAAEALKNNPYVDDLLIYEAFWFYPVTKGKAVRDYLAFLKLLRSKYYDLVIEARADVRDIALLAYPSRSRYRVSYDVGGGGFLLTHVVPFNKIKHKVEYHLDIVRHLGVSPENIEWDIYLSHEEQSLAEKLLHQEGVTSSDFLIGIHPGGRKDLKCWSAEGFAKVADRLISEYNADVVFTGSQQERELVNDIINIMNHKAVNLAGKTNLRILSALIKNLDLFICNDSAPLHIASVIKIPTIAIFGPSKSKETGPYGNIHRVVEKDFPCRYTCDEDVCFNENYHQCIREVSVEDVVSAVEKTLSLSKMSQANVLGKYR